MVEEVSEDGVDQLTVATIAGTSVVGLVASEGYGGDAALCRDDAALFLGEVEGIVSYAPTPHVETGAPLIGGDGALAFAIYDAVYSEGGQSFQARVYVQCRTLVPGRAVLAVVWIVPIELFDADLAAFEGLLAGIDVSLAEIRTTEGADQGDSDEPDADETEADEPDADEPDADQPDADEAEADEDDVALESDEDEDEADDAGGGGQDEAEDEEEDQDDGRDDGQAEEDEGEDDQSGGDAGGGSYVSPTWGYKLIWDDRIWAEEEESSQDGFDQLVLRSEAASVILRGYGGWSGDPDACLEGIAAINEDRDDVVAFEPAQGVAPPESPPGAAGGLFRVEVEIGDGETGEFYQYEECRTLVEGLAVVQLSLIVAVDRYEEALPQFEDLAAGLEVPELAPANEEDEDEDEGDEDEDEGDEDEDEGDEGDEDEGDEASEEEDERSSDGEEDGGDDDVYVSPTFDWSIEWDAAAWEVAVKTPRTESMSSS